MSIEVIFLSEKGVTGGHNFNAPLLFTSEDISIRFIYMLKLPLLWGMQF